MENTSSNSEVPEVVTVEGKVLKGTSHSSEFWIPHMLTLSRPNIDIAIQCLPEDSSHPVLSALSLTIRSFESEDSVDLERVSPTTWTCNHTIELWVPDLRCEQRNTEVSH
jgi:hypothetical protein